MVFKKIDSRIKILIENCIEERKRSFFVLIGEKARDQIAILYNILVKAQIKGRPSVLWCYKKELDLSGNRKKRLEKLKRRKTTGLTNDSENLFDIFVESSKIRFCFYNQTQKILGNTFGMLILQDFEALTPNVLARTVETIEGGGIICLLLNTVASLRQLYTMTMDVHARYRTECFNDVCHRFNERFLLSLNDCASIIIADDQLNILPIFSKNLRIEKIPKRSIEILTSNQEEIESIRASFVDTQPLGTLLNFCRTCDQARALCKSLETILSPLKNNVIALTAPRGRGKSACLGLLISGVISLGISNIYVTASSPENIVTLFEFLKIGLIALGYDEKTDFEICLSHVLGQKLVTSFKIIKNHKQYVTYINPNDSNSAYNAELLVCDEAAAIPLPVVKRMLGAHNLILSSTVNGYEGTGRALSLKLIKELRESKHQSNAPQLIECSLSESIRYAQFDPVEEWLNKLLCLDDNHAPKPEPALLCAAKDCQLYFVSRDTLFSYHKIAELFLQSLISLFVASHYKNSPNDLQLLADAASHQIFVLLPKNQPPNTLPQVLCAIQVSLEGRINASIVRANLGRGQRGSGDLVPWTICQQFCEPDFATLSGARIVRIATHPDFMQMGYGSRAVELLIEYFKTGSVEPQPDSSNIRVVFDSVPLIEERLISKTDLPPLLQNLSERSAEAINYVGVSYGLTPRLLKFWKRLQFVPLYLRQTTNELTGEHTCVMIRPFESSPLWLSSYFLGISESLLPSLALSLMYYDTIPLSQKCLFIIDSGLTSVDIDRLFKPHDIRRLENYSKNLVDHHFIMDLMPKESGLEERPNWVQLSILLSVGFQHKSLEMVEKEINIPMSQILAMFNKIIRKTVTYIDGIKEQAFKESSNLNSASTVVQNSFTTSNNIEKEEPFFNNENPTCLVVPRPEKRSKI